MFRELQDQERTKNSWIRNITRSIFQFVVLQFLFRELGTHKQHLKQFLNRIDSGCLPSSRVSYFSEEATTISYKRFILYFKQTASINVFFLDFPPLLILLLNFRDSGTKIFRICFIRQVNEFYIQQKILLLFDLVLAVARNLFLWLYFENIEAWPCFCANLVKILSWWWPAFILCGSIQRLPQKFRYKTFLSSVKLCQVNTG